jgi:ATPase family associated with various cellular activities (AAA)
MTVATLTKKTRTVVLLKGGRPAASRVLVLGSLRWARALVPNPDGRTYDKHDDWVGVPIIRDMIVQSLSDRLPKPHVEPASPRGKTAADLKRRLGHITAVFNRFQTYSTDPKGSAKVLRLEQNYRERIHDYSAAREAIGSYLSEALDAGDALGTVDVVAVYDHDGSMIGEIVRALSVPRKRKPFEGRSLILACRDQVDASSLKALCARLRCGPNETAVVVTASWLRKGGANIVEYGSIEQTLREIVSCAVAKSGPLPALLRYSAHVVILFEETGAAYLRRDRNGRFTGSFHFCPNLDDVAQAESETYGRSPSQTALVLAALVRQVASERKLGDFSPALRLAVAAANAHFTDGFDVADPFNSAKSVLSAARCEELRKQEVAGDKTTRPESLASSLKFEVDMTAAVKWTRLGAWRRGQSDDAVRQRLRELVTLGPEVVFRNASAAPALRLWYPSSSISCPYLRIGRLKILDSEEIQGFLALSKLIRQYLGNAGNTRPLSIAVFGAPGSGKSTAVKELVDSVRPGAGQAVMPYNLSQLESVGALTEAFHQIQDRALGSSQVPIVMFDEFDCAFDKAQLGWLKYFLAPMQDGEFLGKSGTYKIGRAIFLFAGGTSRNFDEFRNRAAKAKPAMLEEMKAAKLTDFVSRLLGYLNVRDVNPPRRRESASQLLQRQVKRALTLRLQLGKYVTGIVERETSTGRERIRIADEVIDAFIDAKKYEHGVRSMESIVKMSRPVADQFVIASLPSRSLLDMHALKFLRDGH